MILTPDSSNIHNVAQIPESTTPQYTDISTIGSSQREPTLNLGNYLKILIPLIDIIMRCNRDGSARRNNFFHFHCQSNILSKAYAASCLTANTPITFNF